MQSVTLVGLRPRAVGNSIENLVSGTADATGNLASNRFPTLGGGGANTYASSVHPHTTASTVRVQQLYDDDVLMNNDVVSPPHNKASASKTTITATTNNIQMLDEYDQRDLYGAATDGGNARQSTRLPAIQSGNNGTAGGKSGSGPEAVKRGTASVILPMGPETAMKLYMHKLSAFEQHEVFEYQKVCT